MPLYEFSCVKCGNKFSEIKKIGDDSASCPSCGSDETKKLISLFSSSVSGAGSSGHTHGAGCGSG
jgi:putative FmdB family regulatory protein